MIHKYHSHKVFSLCSPLIRKAIISPNDSDSNTSFWIVAHCLVMSIIQMMLSPGAPFFASNLTPRKNTTDVM